MIFINECYKEEVVPKKYAEGFVKMIYPITPHVGEEMWQILGHDNTIAFESWPEYDESKLTEDTVEIAVQVNGKLRATININVNDDEETIKQKALSEENVIRHTEGKEIVKVIVIRGKIVNIVVK